MVRFQAVDWREDDDTNQYSVRVYGREVSTGASVSVCIRGYRPRFYVKFPDQDDDPCTSSQAKASLQHLKSLLGSVDRIDVRMIRSADFWGFRPEGTKFWFAEIMCRTKSAFNRAKRALAPRFNTKTLGNAYSRGFRLYETNIDPMTRMFHATSIRPCGVLEVIGDYVTVETNKRVTTCAIELICEYSEIRPVETAADIAPVRTACFDIEASSSHGDFPLPKKSFAKLAGQIRLAWDRCGVADRTESTVLAWIRDATADGEGGTSEISRIFPKRSVREQLTDKLIHRIAQTVFTHLQGSSDAVDIDAAMTKLVTSDDGYPLEGDKCIQIGLTINVIGCDVSEHHVVVLGECEPIPNAKVYECRTEEELFMRFASLVRDSDVDILSGFNTWGFDWEFMMDRCEQLEVGGQRLFVPASENEPASGIFLPTISKHTDRPATYVQKKLSSSALGDNFLKFVDIPGIAQFDLMKYAQKEYKLDSYSLRNVSTHFLRETKVDLSPQELFRRFASGTPEDIRIIAEYAIQDCALCNKLITKLDIVPGSFAMANVSIVNFMTLYVAGQTKKVQSLLLAETMLQGMLVPSTQDDPEIGGWPDKVCRLPGCGGCSEDPIYGYPWSPGPLRCPRHAEEGMVKVVGFQGAIVLPPVGMDGTHGGFISLDHPCAAQDFASLYPSCIRSRGMCHSSIILDKDRERYANLPGYEYYTSEFDTTDHLGNKVGVRRVTYCHKEGKTPVLPLVLEKLLTARKVTRRRIKSKRVEFSDGRAVDGILDGSRVLDPITMDIIAEGDVVRTSDTYSELMKSQLECLQLAFKISANSCYGALTAPGAAPLKLRDIGQSVTAEGRAMVMLAKEIAEENGGVVRYGDTDSVFVAWPDVRNVPDAIRRGKELEKIINDQLPPCQEIELEKIAFPMILFTPKRYCYMTHDPDEPEKRPKFVAMGIQIKKRDTSAILKKVQQGMIDCILRDHSTDKAMRFLTSFMDDLIAGKYDLDEMIISKALRANYKNPEAVAHKVLAERIASRNQFKPQVNDRIPYAYIIPENPRPDMLQGERIEHPDWIRTHPEIKVDVGKYIDLISRPISQLIALFLDERHGCYADFSSYPPDSVQTLKERWVQQEIFGPLLQRVGYGQAKVQGATRITPRNQRPITSMFKRSEVTNDVDVDASDMEDVQTSDNDMWPLTIHAELIGKLCKTKSRSVRISIERDMRRFEQEFKPEKMSMKLSQNVYTSRCIQKFVNENIGSTVRFSEVTVEAWKQYVTLIDLAEKHELPSSRYYEKSDVIPSDMDMQTRSDIASIGWLRQRCRKLMGSLA